MKRKDTAGLGEERDKGDGEEEIKRQVQKWADGPGVILFYLRNLSTACRL